MVNLTEGVEKLVTKRLVNLIIRVTLFSPFDDIFSVNYRKISIIKIVVLSSDSIEVGDVFLFSSIIYGNDRHVLIREKRVFLVKDSITKLILVMVEIVIVSNDDNHDSPSVR